MIKRMFEYSDDKSNKFQEITVVGKKGSVRYGKIGTEGQNTLKELDAPAEATTHGKKVISEKVKKGYKENK